MKAYCSKIAALALATLLLSACIIEDREDDGPNVSLESLSSPESKTYSPGEPFSVDFSIRSKVFDDEHVGVTFFIIEESKADQLENDPEAEEFEVGEFFISQLSDGVHNYTAELMVPNDLVTAGDYRIVGILDAAGVLETEANDDDNFSQANNPNTYGNMLIDLESHHDFILSKIEVGEGFLLLPQPAEHDATETAEPDTLVSDLIGFVDAIKHGDEVNSAEVVGNFTLDGLDYTAHFWHEDDDEYTDSMSVVFPNHEEEHFFPWDIALNGELVHALFDSYDDTAAENTLSLTLQIVDTSLTGEESTTNNSLTIEIPYFFFEEDTAEPTNPLVAGKTSVDTSKIIDTTITSEDILITSTHIKLSESYSHTYGDKSKVAISMSFDTSNYVYGSSSRADAATSSSGDFTLSIFDNSASLLSSSVEGYMDVLVGSAGYEVGVSVLGFSVIDESDSIADRATAEWDRTWDEEQTLFSSTFVIAIFPVTVEAGVEGSIGIGASLGFDSGVFTATGTVFSASLSAYAEASLNVVVASAGVRADFTIVEDSFDIVGTLDLSEAITDRSMTIGIDITNELKAIEGDFYAFVRYPYYKFCCSGGTKEKDFTIYNTGALYDKTWTFLSDSRTFTY